MALAFCFKCDYPLAGVPSPCPECGRAFDPANPKTFSPKPNARRRRWTRRIATAILIVLAIELLAPRQVSRIAFAWPNPDGQTITIHTRWCFVRPTGLPIHYPSWSSERVVPTTSAQIPVLDQLNWRVGLATITADGGFSIGMPSTPGFVGTVTLGATNPPAPDATTIIVLRENMEELCQHLVYERDVNKPVMFSLTRRSAPASTP